MDKLCRANKADVDRIVSFYKEAIDKNNAMAQYGRWIFGLHPSKEMILAYIENGHLYYLEEKGEILAAAAATPFQGEDYHNIPWNINARDDDVAVIHILCVDPEKQKQGIGKRMMRALTDMAKENGKKAVRLDALYCNLPAHKLYDSLGFRNCGEQCCYASNTGGITFCYFELIL